jgi:predicted DNA-binding protein
LTDRYKLGPDVDLDVEIIRDKKGRRITEVRAAQLADEALSKVGRGRPSLAGGPSHSPQVSFRAPAELRVRAEERAAREGKTVSQLAREALERLLAS